VERFVGLELKDYRRIFRTANDNEAGGLDNVARRFAWLRRLLGTYDQEAGRVFPPEWRVGWALFVKFTEITR
jgi:vacuolar protein sorting-associated protein 53